MQISLRDSESRFVSTLSCCEILRKPAFAGRGRSLRVGWLQKGASKTGRIIESKLSRASEVWSATTSELKSFEGGLTGDNPGRSAFSFVSEQRKRDKRL
jgi:hypothetical protein